MKSIFSVTPCKLPLEETKLLQKTGGKYEIQIESGYAGVGE